MAARSSSSNSNCHSNSVNGKIVALDSSYDGPSEVMKVGVKKMSKEAEISSFMGKHDDFQNDKGEAIISGTSSFDENITGGKVVTTKNLEAENLHYMAVISNFQNKSLTKTQGTEMDAVGECRCCFWDYPLANMIECPNRHHFCFDCIRRRVEEIIHGGSKAHSSLSCMEMDGCEESIPFSEIHRVLPHDIIEKYEARQAHNAVVEANIEDLVYCPFCNIPCEADKCLQVLDCPNSKCLKASFIQCKKMSHLPLRCEEGEEKSVTALRREVEERMTKAVIRECNKCKAKLIKIDGCNSVTCRCGNTMCYVCRHTIEYMALKHFCSCLRSNAEPGKPCKRCNRCSYINENEEEEHEALAAKEEALNEFIDKEPQLLDQEIGPPFKSLKRQQSTQQHGWHNRRHNGRRRHNRRHLENMAMPPGFAGVPFPPPAQPPILITPRLPAPQFSRNMAMLAVSPPQQIFRLGDQLENAALPPQRPAPPHFFRFNGGHQLENTAVAPGLAAPPHFFMPPRLAAPPHFFRFDHGHRLQNVALPPGLAAPPHFFGFDYGHQLQNLALPPRLAAPQHFFRFDGVHQFQNTVAPPPLPAAPHFFTFGYGHQLENMGARHPPVGFLGLGDQLPNSAVPPQVLTSSTRLSSSLRRS